VTQAVERLLCKCEALSSNPSPTKKKKKVSSGLAWSLEWCQTFVIPALCYPSIWETEARTLRVQDQPGLHSKILSQKKSVIYTLKIFVCVHSLNRYLLSY
jgi:hypothetical protein